MQHRPSNEPQRVHVAITRVVKPGCEAAFEAAIAPFFEHAENAPGAAGAYLIRPFQGAAKNEYGVLRSFDSPEAMERFYRSSLYRDWTETVRPLVVGAPSKHRLHGMEAFFRATHQPPAWKMALITWLGVNPAVFLSAQAVGWTGVVLPPLVELMLVNVLVVATLTWVVMPLLTTLFRGWLAPEDDAAPA
ncbi:MAG: antibiotic biosynthesis monooxygenase [Acidobacteriota bacterium]